MIVTLRKTIKSAAHNAPWNQEIGSHWPAGQQFKKTDTWHRFGETGFEQVGVEEVLLIVRNERIAEIFGEEATR